MNHDTHPSDRSGQHLGAFRNYDLFALQDYLPDASLKDATISMEPIEFLKISTYAATLTKGTHLQIVGEIQMRDFVGRDGAKKCVTEIRVHRIARLDRPKIEYTEAAE